MQGNGGLCVQTMGCKDGLDEALLVIAPLQIGQGGRAGIHAARCSQHTGKFYLAAGKFPSQAADHFICR